MRTLQYGTGPAWFDPAGHTAPAHTVRTHQGPADRLQVLTDLPARAKQSKFLKIVCLLADAKCLFTISHSDNYFVSPTDFCGHINLCELRSNLDENIHAHRNL